MSATAGKAKSATSQTFVTSLVTNGALLALEVGAFTYLKQHLGRIYTPRTYLPPPDKRAEELPKGIWRWAPAILLANPKDIIHKNGLDAYMFLRWLRMMIIIFFVFTLITWPVLLPVDAADVKGSGESGINALSWSNITPSLDNRLAAHIVIIYILTFFVFWLVRREMLHFVHMRHQFLISKSHARGARARTVLVTALPDEFGEERALREFASFVPGGVDRIWIYRDSKHLNELFEERLKACARLENACAKLLRLATKTWNGRQKVHTKEVKAIKKQQKKGGDVEKLQVVDAGPLEPKGPSFEFLEELVPRDKRPQHRIGKLHVLGIGKKVDTIEYCKDEIGRLNKEINEARAGLGKTKSLGSAFIECNLQLGAHVLAQCVSYHEPLMMADKWMEISPKDVIWANLDDGAYEMRTRYVTSWIATIALIIGWAFPVAFVGTLSNLDDLCQEASWLRWVCKVQAPWLGLLQGVLPPVLLAVLMILLPQILRALAWYECIPLHSLIDISVYKRYYALLVIHGFLIVTLSSGIVSTIHDIIEKPTSAVEELASNLPNASIFFLTYMATQGLSGAASALIQLGPLVVHFVKRWFLGRTPRQAYGVTFVMPSADFGVVLPRLSLLATIGLAYSVISPLINGLALVGFSLFFLAWKFLLTMVFDQPEEAETGGLYFPIAIQNLFVGLYIEQICLACLFFLKISSAEHVAGPIVEGVLMIVLLVITAAFHLLIDRSFKPIIEYLPMSLATHKLAQRYRKHSTAQKPHDALPIPLPAGPLNEAEEELVDMFSRDNIRSVVRRRVRPLKKLVAPPGGTIRKEIDKEEAQDNEMRKRRKGGEKAEKGEKEKSDVKVAETNGSASHDVKTPVASQHKSTSASAGPSSQVIEDAKELDRPASQASHHSGSSKSSKKKMPTFDPPAEAQRGDDESDDEVFEDHAFDHPSTYEDQPWIWVPQDELGFSEILVNEIREAGVEASDVGAAMDKTGMVDVTRNPPDEEWSGGHDR